MKHLFTLLLSLFTLAWAADTSYTATCPRVYDGDTFVASKDNTAEEIKIRLYGIDAPENAQDTALKEADKAARKAKRGIWAASAPVPPWKWRKANKMNH